MGKIKTSQKHSRKLHTSRNRTNYIRPSVTRKIILFVIPTVFIAVFIALFFTLTFSPEKTTKSTIEHLAADYYETYLYPSIDSSSVAKFAERGFSTIALRQLLLYDNQKNSNYSDAILKYCDENETTIRFYPDSPYGKSDYHVEYHYSCEF